MQDSHRAALLRPLEGVRILLVEDDSDARELFALLLTINGAAVVAVGSVADALEALARERVDAVVSDVHMPGESGLDLIRKVRKATDGAGLPAVAVTADRDQNLHARLIEAGFQTRLAKPVSSRELVGTLRDLVRAA